MPNKTSFSVVQVRKNKTLIEDITYKHLFRIYYNELNKKRIVFEIINGKLR